MSQFTDMSPFNVAMRRARPLGPALFVMLLMATGSAAAQNAAGDSEPTLADYNAKVRRLAMAKIDAEIKQAEEGSHSDNPRGGIGAPTISPPVQSAYAMPARQAAPTLDPTVIYVRPSAKGAVAQLAYGDGAVEDAWAGKKLRDGSVVQSINGSDVTIGNKAGSRTLPWGGGSPVASPSQVRANSFVVPPQVPGVPALPPPAL